jgi:glucose-6-phosphate 1-dehydrogenase
VSDRAQVTAALTDDAEGSNPTSQPCVLLVFGASGDLTKRLLVPAIYNLACDGLLADRFALLGAAMDPLTTDSFRARMSEDIKRFHTRHAFDQAVWDRLVSRFHYLPAGFADANGFAKLRTEVARLDAEYQIGGNVLFYFATAPRFFGLICEQLHRAGFKDGPGWKRIIVEKPFGTDLASALKLNQEVLTHWHEDQIYRVDHYLGKETVQNLLAFRFSNGMFEPLWNKHFIDNIQFNVAEAVDVEGRGGYYDGAGVLRDMMQNHMFQMLAYLCMEVPGSLESSAIRNEKAKLLEAVRVYTPEEVARYAVRGQYGPEVDEAGTVIKPGYRHEKDVDPQSRTETFAAARFHIDNWRWEGVPVYLRSGKALWKRGTEIIVEFKRAPQVLFRNTPVRAIGANRLIFHIQPYQGIEVQFHAKIPGPTLRLQPVNMRFGYADAFKASRYTGYEVMIYSCTHGDATLFSRGDLVEAAWRVAQPLLDYWQATPADFPNYARGTWGPTAACDLIERDGRHWFELLSDDVLKKVPIFKDGDPLFLSQVILALRPEVAAAGETLIRKGDVAREMYVLVRGQVEVLDDEGSVLATLKDGACFGETALLIHSPRTRSVRAKTGCDLLALDATAFSRILHDHPHFLDSVLKIARERYSLNIGADSLLGQAAPRA